MPLSHFGFRTYLALIAAAIILFLAFSMLKFSQLVKKTAKLNSISNEFPRDYFVGLPSNPSLNYVALGDSTIQGTGAMLLEQSLPYQIAQQAADKGRYVHVINLGVSGARLKDVRKDQLPKLQEFKADLISLNIGANDTTHFTPYLSYQADLIFTFEQLTINPHTQILAANTPDMHGIPALPAAYGWLSTTRAVEQNKIFNRVMVSNQITVIDLFNKGKLPSLDLYAADHFHPNAAGYARWASLYH